MSPPESPTIHGWQKEKKIPVAHVINERRIFNVETPLKIRGKKAQMPASKSSRSRVRLQRQDDDLQVTSQRLSKGNPNRTNIMYRFVTGLRFAALEVGL